jgi:hypothetical protein
MATTTLIQLHAGNGGGIAAAIGRSVDYVENPDKTNGGEWVTAYECDPLTVAEEFMFSKRQYAAQGGRDYGERSVIGYHLRQAFKPGEIDAETANKIGYDLAMSFTKGRFAFVSCTHTDKGHIHSHIIINSVSLDCKRKFRNFKNSSFAIRRILDRLCLENGLSVIENPKPSRGGYGKYLGDKKPPTEWDKLREVIDGNIVIGRSLDDYFAALKRAGIEIKSGKQMAFKLPGGKKFFRQDTLGDDYSATAIMERLSGKRLVKTTSPDSFAQSAPELPPDAAPELRNKPNLLIDIQKKMQEGYGQGFLHWASLQNVQSMAKTLMFMKENGLNDYEDLVVRQNEAAGKFHSDGGRIKELEERQN